jgi:hypothetical protein
MVTLPAKLGGESDEFQLRRDARIKARRGSGINWADRKA